MPFTDQGQGHSWIENMQQLPLAPYKIISIAIYKCFSQRVALCQNIKTWWWMATLWTVCVCVYVFHYIYFFFPFSFCFDENTALTWGVWDASCQIHKIPTWEKKKKHIHEGEKINISSPVGFTLQLRKKKRMKKVVTAYNRRSLLTQVTHTKEKYKGKTRADNICCEATM